MGTVFDLVTVGIILLLVLLNYFKGIFKTLKSFKFMAAVMIALEFKDSAGVRAVIGKFINFDEFRLFLRERLDSMWGETLESTAASGGSVDGLFGGIANLITNITDYCKDAMAGGVKDFTASVLDSAAASAESFFVQIIGFIALLIVSFLFLTLISIILTAVLNHGILKHVNRILGGIAGLIFGFVIAWVLSIFLVNILPMISSVEPETVTNGFFGIVKWFHNDFTFSKVFGVTPIL